MAFLIGLALIPFGALFGMTFVLLLASFTSPSLLIEAPSMIIPIVAGFGTLFAAPVTAIALPAAYGVIRRHWKLSAAKLALAGMVSGFIPIIVFTAAVWSRTQRFNFDIASGTVALGAMSGTGGLFSGVIFAWTMRRLRPEHWRPWR